MKKLLISWLVLTSLLAGAQVPYVTVQTTVNGTVVKKVVPRDPSVFPATPSGTAAFLTAVNTGTLSLKPIPSIGSIVGRYSYSFSDGRHDFQNRTLVSDPAPVLTDGPRSVPRLLGNYYPLAPQLGLNTALYKRFPTFDVHDSKIIIYPGGLYSGSGDNELTTHGWTHTAESAKWIDGAAYPTNFRRALEMANYQAAYQAGLSCATNDPRRQKLLDWAGPLPAFEGAHLFIDDEETCKLYAAYWWATFKQADWKGEAVDYFSVNHESFVARSPSAYDYVAQWYRQVGWITKEIIRLAAVEGVTLKSGMSDWGNLTHPSPYFFDDNDGLTGYPRYMSVGYIVEPYRGSSQNAPLGNANDLGQLVKDGKAFVGVGSYVQHTWDEQSLFEKNTNGTYKLGTNGGLIWRTDKRTTSVTGQTTVLYNEDAYKSQLKFYGIFARYCANQFFRAGSKHLPISTDRQSGFENVRFLRQFRLDTESESGISPSGTGTTQEEFNTLNSRALNPDWTEADAIGMYLFNDYLRGWMETQPKTDLGADNGKISKSRASVEMYTKGFHRASQLNWIFDTPWQLVQPKLWIRNQGIVSAADPDEQFYRKPIILGGIATKDGKPTLWLYWWWPCQDVDKYTDVTIWADKGSGPVTPGYRIRIKGRKAGLEYWALPDAAAGLTPTQLKFQFKSLLGEKITWTGDYRDAKITSQPTPPTVVESELSGGIASTPTTTTATSTTAPAWITNLRFSYATPLLTIDGAGQIGKLKFDRQDGIAFSVGNPDGVVVNSGTFYPYASITGQAPYDRHWQLYYSGPTLIVTAQKANATDTYSYTLTPGSPADRVVLTGATSSTTTSTTTTTTTIAAFSQTIQSSAATKSDFVSPGGGFHTDQYITPADYADYSISGAPVTAGDYTLTFNYQTNFDCSGCGTGTYLINNGTPVNFAMDGAGGGTRTLVIPNVALTAGSNTIRFRGTTQPSTFFQNYIIVSRAASTSTTSTTVTSTTTAGGGSGDNTLAARGLDPNFTAPADQGWNVRDVREKFIENNTLKIGFLRGGAAISYAALKANNRNLVNSAQVYYTDDPTDFRYHTSTDDLGRQIMFFSDYCTPSPTDNNGQGFLLKNGKKTSTGYGNNIFNTGANPVQGGSLYPALDLSPILSSAVYDHPTRGREFYAKIRPMLWGVKGEPGWIVGEMWCYFVAENVLAYKARHTVEERDPARFDEQRKFKAQSQENPSIYTIANLTQYLVDIPGENRKNIYPGVDGTAPKYYTTTCRIGAYEGNGGTGITYYSPGNSQVGAMHGVSSTGNWGDNAYGYIQGAPALNYDNPGVYEDSGYIIFGTEGEANAAIANLPGIDQSFDFDFSKENMRWFNSDSRLIHETGGWTLYLDSKTENNNTTYELAKMMAPARAWQASNLTTVNFEIACTNTTTLKLEWQKPGLNYLNQYHKEFSVIADGQFHTYSVSTSDANFTGTISSVGFSAGSTTQANAKVVVRHIWKP